MNTFVFCKRLESRRLQLATLPLIFALLTPSCSDKQQAPSPPPPSLEGKIVIKGSNTIGEELAPRLIAEYKKEHPAANVELESKLTGYGLAALIAGQCNIASASRAPLPDEVEQARVRNVELDDHIIGSYSVAVIVNSACPVSDLKREQIRDIFTGAIQNWKDVGGPDAPISCTFATLFRALIMDFANWRWKTSTTRRTGILSPITKELRKPLPKTQMASVIAASSSRIPQV